MRAGCHSEAYALAACTLAAAATEQAEAAEQPRARRRAVGRDSEALKLSSRTQSSCGALDSEVSLDVRTDGPELEYRRRQSRRRSRTVLSMVDHLE